jgi:ATP-dependent helicase Lhr and Lhr-like helicase
MPQFTVLNGRQEAGRTDPALLTAKTDGPRPLLAGHSWQVTWIDWKRRRCFVESADAGGKARRIFPRMGGASFALSRAIRDVLLGADRPARLTRRASRADQCPRDRPGTRTSRRDCQLPQPGRRFPLVDLGRLGAPTPL